MTLLKPLITPLSSIRSTRRLTAGADNRTRSPISANVARACRASSARICSSMPSNRSITPPALTDLAIMTFDAIKAAYKSNEHRYIVRRSPLPLIYDDLRGIRDRHAASSRYGHRTPRADSALRHDAAAVLRGRLCDQSVDGYHQP